MFSHIRRCVVIISVCLSCTSPIMASENQQYHELEWTELIPQDDLDALLNPPKELLNISEGAEADSLDELPKLDSKDPKAERYYQALKSAKVVNTLDGKLVKIPGFVVPLQGSEDQLINEFLIVPYFGACIHLPPPPPNQIIYGTVVEGFELESLYQPMVFSGKLSIQYTNSELGEAAYQIKVNKVALYEE